MSRSKNSSGGRRNRNMFTTKSGNAFKIHRNLTERWVARKDATERRKAERLAGLPKSRLKRFLYHFQPKRMYRYWFSRDGGIMMLKIIGIGFVAVFLILIGVFAYFRKDLPNLSASGNDIGGSIRYYDRSGQTLLWQDYDAVKRIPVQTPDMSKYVREATVAVEDKDFYKHGGFDVRGIVRAGLNDALGRGATQGGSTITQQLVKISENWTTNRTITRKVKEVILAVELERSYSKDDILTGYLNTAPYGNIEYGVEAASRDYFHIPAKDLTLDEAAFLAAIPKSPSVYSPYGPYFDKQDILVRQHYILDLMAQQGYITQDQASAAKKVNILAKIHPQETKFAGIIAPYFVLAAKSQLEAQFGAQTVNRGGWKVNTTLDMKLQKIAEHVVASNNANALSHGADEQSIVAEDVKTGEMVALVGGTDFSNADHGKINYAQWNISPGSSFKPYDYVSLIENSTNVGAGSVLYDSQGPIPGYDCTIKGLPPPKGNSNCLQDYDFRNPGPLTLRYALGGSRNIPAVKAMLTVGTDKVINTADDLMQVSNSYKCYRHGVDVNTATTADEVPCYGSSAIGDGAYLHLDNHVNGLASLARMGTAIKQTYILSITDANNKTVPLPKRETKQVVRPDSAYIVDNMASDPNASYLPFGYYKWQQYNGWRTAVKTGTTNNGFDGLMMAWNTQYAVGSWVGFHTRNQPLLGAMEYSTTPLTRGFMTAALDSLHTSPINWKQPSDIKVAPAYVVRTHVGIGSVEPSPSTDLYPSWYTGNTKSATANKPIDVISNKLATSCTPALAKKNAGNSNANIFSVDIFVNGGAAGSNTSATDDVHHCDDVRPSIDSITFSDSGSGDCTSPCTITVSASGGTHPLFDPKYASIAGTGKINLLIDGKVVQSKQAAGSVNFSYSGSGSHQVSAQVVDSVLYDSTSDALTENFVGNSISNISAFFTDNRHMSVTWTGPSDDYQVDVSGPINGACNVSSGDPTHCIVTFPLAPSGTYTVTITGNNSGQTGTKTVNKP